MDGVAFVAFIVLAWLVTLVLTIWPLCRALKDGQRALDGLVDAEARAADQRAQWRAEGRSVVLVPEREVRP